MGIISFVIFFFFLSLLILHAQLFTYSRDKRLWYCIQVSTNQLQDTCGWFCSGRVTQTPCNVQRLPQELFSKETFCDKGLATSLLWVEVTGVISFWMPSTKSSHSGGRKADFTNGCLSQKPTNDGFVLTDFSTMVGSSPNYFSRHSTKGQTSGLKPKQHEVK